MYDQVELGAPLSVEHQIGGACPGTTLVVTVHTMVRVLSGKRGVPGIGRLTPPRASLQSSRHIPTGSRLLLQISRGHPTEVNHITVCHQCPEGGIRLLQHSRDTCQGAGWATVPLC